MAADGTRHGADFAQSAGAATRRIATRELGEKLASTDACDVHAFATDEVVKLYRRGFDRARIEEHARLGALVVAAGLPAPAIRPQLLETPDGRIGIAYERAHGPTIEMLYKAAPLGIARHSARLATQHRLVHARRGLAGLPMQRERLRGKLERCERLPEGGRERLLRLLESLPDADVVCHGDFHWGNVLAGPTRHVVIDWSDAALGSVAGDVARTWVLLRYHSLPGAAVYAYTKAAAWFYARSYLGAARKSAEFQAWQLVQSAARLDESIGGLGDRRLLEYVLPRLARLR